MSIESSQAIDQKEIFRETFNSPFESRRKGMDATSVVYLNGIGTFDGADSKIETNSNFIGTGDLTFVIQFKLNSWGESDGYFLTNDKFILFLNSSGTLIKATSDASTEVDSGVIALDTEYELVVTRTTTGVVNFYINGFLSGTADQASGVPSEVSTVPVVIGNNAGQSRTFDGEMKIVKVLSGIWSAKDAELHYENALYTDNKIGLIGHWMLSREHSTGRVFYDLSGKGHNGTKDNDPTFSYDQHGREGKSVKFSGNANKVVIGDLGLAKSFTMWIKTYYAGMKEILRITGSYVTIRTDETTGVTTAGVGWSTPTYYMNGEIGAGSSEKTDWRFLVVTQTTGIATTLFALSTVASNDFRGRMSEVRVYDRVLTPTEIRMAYKRGRL